MLDVIKCMSIRSRGYGCWQMDRILDMIGQPYPHKKYLLCNFGVYISYFMFQFNHIHIFSCEISAASNQKKNTKYTSILMIAYMTTVSKTLICYYIAKVLARPTIGGNQQRTYSIEKKIVFGCRLLIIKIILNFSLITPCCIDGTHQRSFVQAVRSLLKPRITPCLYKLYIF